MSFRFLHAADIHLDSPLRGLASAAEHEAHELLTASRQALEKLVEFAIAEQVAFVVIAGDLYDGDWKDYQTGLFLVAQLGRLRSANIPVYLLHGNHDAESTMTKSLPLPDNTFTFSAKKAQSFTVAGHEVCLHGRSFDRRDVTENLVPQYPAPVPGQFNIGVLHTALEGGSAHANYAPCSLGELQTHGYDYWALGHVHQFEICAEHPHVVYPGNLQGRHIRETGPKGACLVTVSEGSVSDVTHVPLDVARWARIEVDVSDDLRFSEVQERIAERIREAVTEQVRERLLACRVLLTGQSMIDGELRARVGELRQSILAMAAHDGSGSTWIEKVKVETTPGANALELETAEDTLGELFRALPEAAHDIEFKQELLGIFHDLRAALPHAVWSETDDPLLQFVANDDVDAIIASVRTQLLSDLARSGQEP